MSKLTISSTDDLVRLRSHNEDLQHIAITCKEYKESGLLRHAFKYAMWALAIGGVLEVIDERSRSHAFGRSRVDFWQIRKEFFKSVGGSFAVDVVDDHHGLVSARKIATPKPLTGVSFGIVYGGGERDTLLLKSAVRSIVATARGGSLPVEIIICGNCDASLRSDLLVGNNLVEISYVGESDYIEAGRILIGKKKKIAFESAKFSCVVISHTRITFDQGFIRELSKLKFDALAPCVSVVNSVGAHRRFLDYVQIGSYDTSKRNTASALASYTAMDRHLDGLRRRVGYIDGGVMIFNRDAIESCPFDPSLAWGEGEDVDACAYLSHRGALIDFDPRVKCTSAVSKFDPEHTLFSKLTWPLKQILIHHGYW